MSDEAAPYSKAIEESAKAGGKAIDLIRDGAHAVGRPVANVYGLLVGDHIEALRERNLDAISRETRRILRERDLAETQPVTEQIAIPLLEAARGETREEMQKLWAQLLANAMDPARRDDVRPEFIQTLGKFHPVDALVLRELKHDRLVREGELAGALNIRESSVVVSLETLESLRCVAVTRSVDAQISHYRISRFGIELLRALSPDTAPN